MSDPSVEAAEAGAEAVADFGTFLRSAGKLAIARQVSALCLIAVVSTDIDGVGDYAEDGRTALMSPARDAEALAANLLRLLRDDTMRVRLAMAGHENIQRFQWEQSTRELERALFADANASAGT